MSFELEVRITGICAFVPNADPHADYKTCAVMPGVDGDKFALDDELLCPHTSWIESLDDHTFHLPRRSLRGFRVRFDVTKEETTDNPEAAASAVGPDLAYLKNVCGDFDDLDPAICSFPPRVDIVTQILLREDKFEHSSGGRWNIGYLRNGTETKNQDLTHEVVLRYPKLKRASLLLDPFPTGRTTSIPLEPRGAAKCVRLQLINNCKDDQPLLGQTPLRDRDFKWYYELMTEAARKGIRADLGPKDLPIPIYVVVHKIGGQDCFPTRTSPVKF